MSSRFGDPLRGHSVEPDASGIALVDSVIADFATAMPESQHALLALRRLFTEWDAGYRAMARQLERALKVQNALHDQIREFRIDAAALRARVYAAEQRALEAEARCAKALEGAFARAEALPAAVLKHSEPTP